MLKSEAKTSLDRVLSNVYGYSNSTKYNDDRKTKVDIIVQDGNSLPKSSAFIRLVAPLTHPSVQDKISLNICEDTSTLRDDAQIIVVQRAVLASEKEASSLIQFVKNKNIKLIVDTDDAFFSLDKNHPNYYEMHSRHDALLHLIKNANQLWVSTENLKKYYQEVCNTPIYIIPNTLDPRVWERNNIHEISDKSPLRLLYMGTATHEADFRMIIPWIDKLFNKHPGSFELHIIGVTRELPKKDWLKPLKRAPSSVIYPNFAKWIQSEGPFDIGLAPLTKSEFNSYKSDIKCLDYLAIGVVPMVSDVDSYDNKNLDRFIFKNSNDKNDWYKTLEEIILNLPKFRKKRLQMLQEGQKYVWEKRSSETASKQMVNLLKIN